MARKSLPNDVTVLRYLLTVTTDCLTFMEPAVRQLEYERQIIVQAVMTKRLDIDFFQKVHKNLSDRIAQGGPAYTAILPYLDSSRIRKPIESIEVVREHIARHRVGDAETRAYLFLCIWCIFEKVGAAKSVIQAVQALQGEIIEKLSTVTSHQALVSTAPAPPTTEANRNSWFHELDEEPPPQYAYGPLEGQKKQLCQWVGVNDRTLTRNCKREKYWIRKIKETQYEMWFRHKGDYAHANKRRLESLNREGD